MPSCVELPSSSSSTSSPQPQMLILHGTCRSWHDFIVKNIKSNFENQSLLWSHTHTLSRKCVDIFSGMRIQEVKSNEIHFTPEKLILNVSSFPQSSLKL